jgi:hypothetical protein
MESYSIYVLGSPISDYGNSETQFIW